MVTTDRLDTSLIMQCSRLFAHMHYQSTAEQVFKQLWQGNLYLQYQSMFQSSNLSDWVRVKLGCCWDNGAYRYVRIVIYVLTSRIRALKSTSG